MCGIVAYVGERPCRQLVLEGLSRLEYRGYDSCGMCSYLTSKKSLSVRKLPGKIKARRENTAKHLNNSAARS